MFTLTAIHSSDRPRDDERTISVADFETLLLKQHGAPGIGEWQTMTLRDSAGVEFRSYLSWRAIARKYGTDFRIQTAAGTVVHTIKMPGFWYTHAC